MQMHGNKALTSFTAGYIARCLEFHLNDRLLCYLLKHVHINKDHNTISEWGSFMLLFLRICRDFMFLATFYIQLLISETYFHLAFGF